jgi:heparanase 1
MLEVTGGSFWKPYGSVTPAKPGASSSNSPVSMSADMYQYRPPIDLANSRRRKLAAALGPSYMRVSGTWANTTFFQDSDDPALKTPPPGFSGVLTRQQWKGVVEFSHAANAEIVTSFATSPGTRDAAGVWTPAEARKFLAYTQSIGGSVAAAEFMNEPTIAAMGGAPKGYDAAAFGRDMAVFRPFIKSIAPEMVILGPGSVGEGGTLSMPLGSLIKSEDLLQAAGPAFDAFSYHFYGAVSKRCAMLGAQATTTSAAALSDDWLSRTNGVERFYAGLRDRFTPGKPLWITETADAACGGNPWGSTFLDSFRYLNQLGSMARQGVQVVAHNTLDASDYGLLDENTLAPRPNYWAALLWRRLMGTTVLEAGAPPAPGLQLYAHCLRGQPGGVTLLVLNTSSSTAGTLALPIAAKRYTLTARDLTDARVELNEKELKLGDDDALPELTGIATRAGNLTFAPASITFLAIPNANNASCRAQR